MINFFKKIFKQNNEKITNKQIYNNSVSIDAVNIYLRFINKDSAYYISADNLYKIKVLKG